MGLPPSVVEGVAPPGLRGLGTSLLSVVSETLCSCGVSPVIRIHRSCRLGLETLAQERILFALPGSQFEAAILQAVQRATECGAARGTDQHPEGLKTVHEVGANIPQQYR